MSDSQLRPDEPQEDDLAPGEELVSADDAAIGRAFRWSLAVLGILSVAAGGIWVVSSREKPKEAVEQADVTGPRERAEARLLEPPLARFVDATAAAGIDFVHESGAYGDKLLPESLGSGAAFFDADGDSDPDLLLVNATHWPGHAPAERPAPTLAFYRNDGTGHFLDETRSAGLAVSLYGTGVAAADYDGDGKVDLFVTALGRNRLFRNLGERFEDVTAEARVGGDENAWSTAAAFLDYDNDGDLDLLVGNYVRWTKEIDFQVDFRLTGIGRAYGPPTTYEGTFPYLYRNDGDGTFTDVSEPSGVQVRNPATNDPVGKTLGFAPLDFDADGWIDVFVANDTVQNFLLRNKGDGTFEDVGVLAGVGFDRDGAATGAMGTDAADTRNDGSLTIGVGNFANEMTSFYVSQGDPMIYADEAIAEGIGPASRLRLSFGLFFFDYDLDGRLDLLQANGHLEDEINKVQSSQHYEQPTQLFWNCGTECPHTFVEVSDERSGDLAQPLAARAATYADIDADGDLDVLLTQVGRRPVLFRNDQRLGHHWLRVRLAGRGANRDAIGARVELTAGGVTQRRQVMPTRSYLSQTELPVTFGLGQRTEVENLRILWPGGGEQVIERPRIDAVLVVEQAS